jgi:hypothetical protein
MYSQISLTSASLNSTMAAQISPFVLLLVLPAKQYTFCDSSEVKDGSADPGSALAQR